MTANGLQRETTEVLQRLVRFNTVNPPGEERAAIEYLAAYVREAGFETELLAADPRRPNLVADLEGSSDGPTLCFLGHVDTVGQVTHLTPEGENWSYGVRVPEDFACYIVPKGSISIDGISLTVARWDNKTNVAEAAIIPYTYGHSNIRDRKPGDAVNLEADILGKYIENYLEAREKSRPGSALTIEELVRQGF